MDLKTKAPALDAASDPAPDPFEGVGGSYRIDPATGRRVQVVAPPDTAPAAAPAPAAAVAPAIQTFGPRPSVVPDDDDR